MSDDLMESDNVIPTDTQLGNTSSNSPSDDMTPPGHKPPVPGLLESGATANSMNRLMMNTANILKNSGNTVKASALKADHPYGDSGHGMGTGHALSRLGAGLPYGGK